MGKVVAANWKMNLRRASAAELASRLAREGRDCWLFPASPHLAEVAAAVAGSALRVGAQDLSPDADGAFTGDVSAGMLADAGCTLVLVGHSERRHGHGEGAELLLRKLRRATDEGLAPLYCVGETALERKAGGAHTVVREQLIALDKLAPGQKQGLCAVAYEPVWAIGTGQVATPAQIGEMHALVRDELAGMGITCPVLYGGSVSPENAAELLAVAGVDGLLVGGASLRYESLSAIDDIARAMNGATP